MSTMGTFDAFTSARLGIYAAQIGLKVTGNNVSNINTEGYTRQRPNQLSFKAGAYDRYRSQMDNHVGSGALVMGINQIRDPYLDVRYRNTSAQVGYNDTMLDGLQRIQRILDEVGKGEDPSSNEDDDGMLYAQIQDLRGKLLAYSKEPTKANDTLVRNSAETLCHLLNSYSNELTNRFNETEEDFYNQVTAVNECLTNIRDLNDEIRNCEIFGDNALELRDERNRQIDTLSQYLHIKVQYSEEDMGNGLKVEKLTISLANDNPEDRVTTDESILIDGIFGAQLSVPEERVVLNPDYGKPGSDLKDFLYLKTVTDNTTAPPTTKVEGTNYVKDADKVPNDNYSLQISKLLDEKGREWTDRTTDRKQVSADAFAKYTLQVNKGNFAEADTFQIGNKTFSVVANDTKKPLGSNQVTVDDANDPEKMAALIAKYLGNSDYSISVDPNNKNTLVFTAKRPGAVGGDSGGPAAEPDVSVLNNNNNQFSLGTVTEVQRGLDITGNSYEKDPDTGTETIRSYQQVLGIWYEATTTIVHTNEVALDDNDPYGSLQATRELLTEAGEFSKQDTVDNIDEDADEKRGIPYYQKSLDLLAKKFAEVYNELNQGYMLNEKGNYIDKNGNEITVQDLNGDEVPINRYKGLTDSQEQNLINNKLFILTGDDGNPILDEDGNMTVDLDALLEAKGAVKMGGVLFSNGNNGDDTDNINASNISVSHGWSTAEWLLVPKYEVLFGGDVNNSTQNINADHMVTMVDSPLLYNPKDIDPDATSSKLFVGSFNDMFDNMNATLGNDMRHTEIVLDNHYTELVETDYNREGVSGVDLNDEAMNMMQYSKAMNAAMRLMTVVDEALDRLINNTGVAGR